MNTKKRRPSVFPTPVLLIGMLLVIFFVFVSGCSSVSRARKETKMLYKNASASTHVYKKTMAVLPFENSTPWATIDMEAAFVPKLTEAIQENCSQVHILLPNTPEFPAGLVENNMDSFQLAAFGRASGVNLILSGRLVGIRHETQDRGMFWFAKVVHLARVQLEAAVLHTGTGAKLIDKTIFQNIEISEAEGELIDAGQMPDGFALTEAMNEIAETLAKTTCDVLKHIPWESYVVNVEEDRIVLAAGAACGLKKGKVLKVYDTEEVPVEDTGQRFFTVGNEIGRITVTSVSSNQSEADLKEGGPIPPGSVVRAH